MEPTPLDPVAAAALFRGEALALGFQRVGFTPVAPVARHAVYRDWLARGYAADMRYLGEQSDERRDARALLSSARTIVTVALSYAHADPADVPSERLARGPRGRIARYARGDDYHVVLKNKLRALSAAVARAAGRAVAFVPCVDTAPLLERELASAGGIGFQAKNTMLIAPGLGSFVLLGELLTDLECAPGPVDDATPRCGQCTRCLEACPTGAFVDAYTLDARRCISYLTIENPGPIPRELRPLVGDHVFGCDICQEVCPFNAPDLQRTRATGAAELSPRSGYARPSLTQLVGLGSAQFRKWQRGSALRRVHRRQLQRNAAVALGNVGTVDELPALMQALGEPALVRAHAAWAIAQIVARSALSATQSAALVALLAAALVHESDDEARAELAAALASARSRRAPA
ncbi:MAG: tRNA epoxyqueuosine(34) reductase QueG [Myxococcales bacterium]|nr:tRNA epoxyqueuosine(34) reductase QueG [Myxococcales bacterium]